MDSIFKKPRLKAQNQRNAFDRSQKRVFHVPFGAIVPCFFQRVNPDDYVELSVESQFICDKIARPAFIRLKEHINYYYVPMSMLWSAFDNFITGQDNYFSTAIENPQVQSKVPSKVPTMDSSFVWSCLAQLTYEKDIHGFNKCVNALRLLDTLGYGNWYQTYVKNADNDGHIDYQDGNLLDQLDDMNLFGLLAYQKVYYDYYRNPKYERNDTSAFNIDHLAGSKILTMSDVSGTQAFSQYKKIFEMHYAWAKKDYFMDVQPSVLPSSSDIGYSGLNLRQPGSPSDNNQNFWDLFGIPGSSNKVNTVTFANTIGTPQNAGTSVVARTSQVDGVMPNVLTNVTALRFAFAYDKLLRRMREAGGTFDKQMLAQFGIVPYDERHGKCFYIGGQTNRLTCTDVTSTSQTSTDLGYLGANINSYSVPRGKFKFHVKDHGIIIGLYNTSLDFDYPSYGLQRDNLARTRFDWFNPVFEDLGLQPIFRNELMSISQQSDTQYVWELDKPAQAVVQHSPLGFVRRYSEFKTNIDRVYGLFDFGQSEDKNKWVTQFFPWRIGDVGTPVPIQLDPLTQVTMSFTPLMFNQIVTTPYDGMWDTDHFDVHQYHHFKVISNMSKTGEVF